MSSRAVKDGQLLYVSPSQITLHQACPKAWWFTYVLGFRKPQTAAQTRGESIHTQMEHWLADRSRNPEHPSALRFVQAHGPDFPDSSLLQIEVPKDRNMGLFIEDTQMVGRIDLLYNQPAPVNHTVILDWKTTSRLSYAKKPEELLADIQMNVYGRYTLKASIGPLVYKHVYLLTDTEKPANFKLVETELISTSEVEKNWDGLIVPAVYELKDTCRISKQEDVPADTKACFAYGGCAFRFGCPDYKERYGKPKGEDPFKGAFAQALLSDYSHGTLSDEVTQEDFMALDDLFKMADNIPKEERINPPDAAPHDELPGVKHTKERLELFIDVAVHGAPFSRLEELIESYSAPICKTNNVKDVREIKYGEGKVALLRAFRDKPPTGMVVAHAAGLSLEVLEVLIPLASVIVRGVR